jgi:uncharacterized protein YggT (Ycf19 family)
LNLLTLGAVVHWVFEYWVSSYRPEILRFKAFLDRIYLPILDTIRRFIKPFTLSDGRQADFSHLILILAIMLIRRILF